MDQQGSLISASGGESPGESAGRERMGGRLIQCLHTQRSPDGTHLLAQSDDHFIDVFKLHQTDSTYELNKVFSLRAPTTLLAAEWYPFARYEEAASWCFAISARDVPTRLIDAYQGRVSCTTTRMDCRPRLIFPLPLRHEPPTVSLIMLSAS